METKQENIGQMIDGLGNDNKSISATPDFIEWMNQNNPLTDQVSSKKTGKCKSGKCGNNKQTFIIVSVILFFVMWAGYGLFTFIENLLK